MRKLVFVVLGLGAGVAAALYFSAQRQLAVDGEPEPAQGDAQEPIQEVVEELMAEEPRTDG